MVDKLKSESISGLIERLRDTKHQLPSGGVLITVSYAFNFTSNFFILGKRSSVTLHPSRERHSREEAWRGKLWRGLQGNGETRREDRTNVCHQDLQGKCHQETNPRVHEGQFWFSLFNFLFLGGRHHASFRSSEHCAILRSGRPRTPIDVTHGILRQRSLEGLFVYVFERFFSSHTARRTPQKSPKRTFSIGSPTELAECAIFIETR